MVNDYIQRCGFTRPVWTGSTVPSRAVGVVGTRVTFSGICVDLVNRSSGSYAEENAYDHQSCKGRVGGVLGELH